MNTNERKQSLKNIDMKTNAKENFIFYLYLMLIFPNKPDKVFYLSLFVFG